MNVLLVQPDYIRYTDREGGLFELLFPSYSLNQLAEILRRSGYNVKVLDPYLNYIITGMGKENDLSKGLKKLLSEEEYGLIGFSIYTPLRKEAFDLIKLSKEMAPKSAIVVGGPHPTKFFSSILKHYRDFVDYVLLGGADESLLQLADNLRGMGRPRFKIPGLAYRDGNDMVQVTSRSIINLELSKLPLVDYSSYLSVSPGGFIPRAYIITIRGCGYWCNFCSNIWKKVLQRPVEQVLEEARHLIEDCRVKELVIYDDCFGVKREHALKVLRGISGFKRRASIQAVSRFDLLDAELVQAFKEAGGRSFFLGLETGSSKLRKKMNKHLDDETICKASELLREFELELGIYLIIGFPGESEEDINSTYRLLTKIEPEQVFACVYDIKPGDMMVEFGLVSKMISEDDYLDEERRLINYLGPDELIKAVGIADWFEQRFTKKVIMPEYDPAWKILGYDAKAREEARKRVMRRG